jgi:hypothetical protein
MDFVTPITTVALTYGSLIVGWYALKKRVFTALGEYMNQYVNQMIDNVIKNPESIAPLLKVLTQSGMKELGIDKEKSLPALKIGGLKIPGYIVQAAMPFIQGQIAKNLPQAAQTVAENALA